MLTFTTDLGVADNDVLHTSGQDVDRYGEHYIQASVGAVDVEVSLDGVAFSAAVALEDLQSATGTMVLLTAGTNVYRLKGYFKKIRVRQSGATGAQAKVFHVEAR